PVRSTHSSPGTRVCNRNAILPRQEGQAVVEAAIVLPAIVFLLLPTIQLTQLQQARIMAEYAAFSAARSGIVLNGDPTKMQEAAIIAVLPTFGRTDNFTELGKTLVKFKAQDLV